MKTSLEFEAPGDLSIGRVKITGAGREVADWVATPDDRTFRRDSLAPGFYTAEITPVGLAPQSLVFEVRRGEANTVVAPHFSALAVNGGGATFIGIKDREAAIDALYGKAMGMKVEFVPDEAVAPVEFACTAEGDVPDAPGERRIAIGLSQETGGTRESWKPFAGTASYELAGGRLSFRVEPRPGWSPASAERVRLSVAIEDLRVERLLLPMYRGGVQISVTPSVLSANDVEIEVMPADPRLRALVRALVAGTPEEAEAVRKLVLETGKDDAAREAEPADPWAEILTALLFIRFPDIFGSLTQAMADRLLETAPWAYDSHVIKARQMLYGSAQDDELETAGAVLQLLARAQAWNSPYFTYSNQLFSELIEALTSFAEAGEPSLRKQADQIRSRWLRDGPLQSSAGASFSWFRRDQDRLKEGMLAPDRSSKGQLAARSTTNLFSGRIAGGQISFGAGDSPGPREPKSAGQEPESLIDAAIAPEACPALKRDPGPENDPNKGRFGENDRAQGFVLRASFKEIGDGEWVSIAMTVEAGRGVELGSGDCAWFCLHPTFQPQWVKVLFRGNAATLVLQAWGGFTLGVWLPEHRVELELDLSQVPGAPKAIVER